MAIHRLGLQFGFVFKSTVPSFGGRTLINQQLPLFYTNIRQFTSRPGLEAIWRRTRVQHVFRLANSSLPVRGARTLRRGLVPGSLAYNVAKNSEANVERTVAGNPVGSTVTGKTVAQSLRSSRARRLSTKENLRGQRETPRSSQESTKSNANKSKETPSEEESQSYFQRPTKEQLLATATSFFHRLHIRFKWPLIRSFRPFNIDDISAFISVYILSHAFLLIAGTTTFFLLIIATINTVGAQEYFARIVGWYLTKESGMTVVFESAIVPKWQGKTIRFERVFVSRRPKGAHGNYVRKGSSVTAAAAAAAAAAEADRDHEVVTDDGNYTQFDLTIESVDVTLSFVKWVNGKGLLENVEMRGVRGVVGIYPYLQV
jgi:mitochondrial distribution and morphology protein 31